MFFLKLKGYDHFNSTDYYIFEHWIDLYSLINFAETNGYIEENSFNIFVPSDCLNCEGVAQDYNKTVVAVKAERLTDNFIMAHEIGHCFDLIHTFRFYNNSNGLCERVTRDETDIDYNATTHGDRVVDTAACSINYSAEDCLYTDDKTDCVGTSYEIFEKDIRSFMGYRHGECRDSFTVGQKIRIREAIVMMNWETLLKHKLLLHLSTNRTRGNIILLVLHFPNRPNLFFNQVLIIRLLNVGAQRMTIPIVVNPLLMTI